MPVEPLLWPVQAALSVPKRKANRAAVNVRMERETLKIIHNLYMNDASDEHANCGAEN